MHGVTMKFIHFKSCYFPSVFYNVSESDYKYDKIPYIWLLIIQ